MDKPVQPSSIPLGEAVLAALESALIKPASDRIQGGLWDRAYEAGYAMGIGRALAAVKAEIGLRLDPPDITYGMESPPPQLPKKAGG